MLTHGKGTPLLDIITQTIVDKPLVNSSGHNSLAASSTTRGATKAYLKPVSASRGVLWVWAVYLLCFWQVSGFRGLWCVYGRAFVST